VSRQVGTRELTRRSRAEERRQAVRRRRAALRQQSQRGSRSPLRSLRTLLRAIPTAARVCALVAFLNAACWSIVTPPFQAPDETDHFAYVKQLAETGTLPSSSSEQLSAEEMGVLEGLRSFQIRLEPQVRALGSRAEQSALERHLRAAAADTLPGSAAAGVATAEPPLYYALEAIPYTIASGGSELDRLALMRLFSALFAGLTAMFAFLFVRELLPGARWAWAVAGLAVALMPMLGFMSGVVNPDALLFAVSAAIFYALARAFRRGLERSSAVAIGALTAIGLLTKVNFVGLVPGVLLGLVVLSARAARVSGRSAYRLLALGLAIAASPIVLYALVNLLSGHRTLGIVSRAIGLTHGSPLAEANYIWQLYLPRLPGTVNDFPGIFTTRQLWFNGYVGLYGWLDTPLPSWAETLALVPAAAIALLCARSLVQGRLVLRERAGEIAVYAAIALGLMLLIGADSYLAFPGTDAEYGQARYLLPLLPLAGVAIALAARGAGRRWGPVAGTLIVVLFLAHDIFAQLQVVARYYG
jgi:hypothetical protein